MLKRAYPGDLLVLVEACRASIYVREDELAPYLLPTMPYDPNAYCAGSLFLLVGFHVPDGRATEAVLLAFDGKISVIDVAVLPKRFVLQDG